MRMRMVTLTSMALTIITIMIMGTTIIITSSIHTIMRMITRMRRRLPPSTRRSISGPAQPACTSPA